MSPATAHFLQRLSHEWSFEVLLAVASLGVASFMVGRARARAAGDPGRSRVLRRLRLVVNGLLAVSVVALIASFLHIGCSYAVASAARCYSNEKQIGMAILLYSQDYNEKLPPAVGWTDALGKYLGPVGQSARCQETEPPSSYGMNRQAGGADLNTVAQPAEAVLLFEADTRDNSYSGGPREVARTRHTGGSNVGFTDGHVKRENADRIDGLVWSMKDATPRKN